MAEIKVNIRGDDEDLKRKFRQSAEEARIFKENVTKSLDAIKEASQNVVSQTGLGGIAKLLGAAGLAGTAMEFSNVLVKGFKDAVSAALDFQGQVGKLRSALGVTFGGQAEALANWVESVSAAFGGFEENMQVFRKLVQAGMVPEEAKKSLIDIQNAAKMLGVNVEELGEKFAEMKARGVVPERFFREFPMLAPIARGLGMPEHPTADWMLKTLLPAIAPGGLEAPGRLRAQTSVAGTMATITEEFQKSMRELGTDLLPLINTALKEFKGYLPEINTYLKTFSEDLAKVVPVITGLMHEVMGIGSRLEHPTTPFGRGLKSVNDYLEGVEQRIGDLFANPAKVLQESAAQQKESAAALHRALNPQ